MKPPRLFCHERAQRNAKTARGEVLLMNCPVGRSLEAVLQFAFVMFWLCGCATHDANHRSITHYAQVVKLTPEKPEARVSKRGHIELRLLSIAEDGTTRIALAGSDNNLTAKPGEYFESREFGIRGLQLVSASKADGVALLRARWAGD